MRPQTHSATPGPSNDSALGPPEPRPAVNDGARSSAASQSQMEKDSDDEIQMFSAPTAPFRRYSTMTSKRDRSDLLCPVGQYKNMFLNPQIIVPPKSSMPARPMDAPEADDPAHPNPARRRLVMPQTTGNAAHPSAPQARQSCPVARQQPLSGPAPPYRDPRGEKQSKCKQCAAWFVFSENHHGACLPRHPGA